MPVLQHRAARKNVPDAERIKWAETADGVRVYRIIKIKIGLVRL